MEMVEVKIREVGNALGIIFPGFLVRQNRLRKGEKIFMSVLKKRRIRLNDVFAKHKDVKPFVREHSDRRI